MTYSKPKSGKYVVRGVTWNVKKALTFSHYLVDTVLPDKTRVRYEAEYPNCSGNLWLGKTIVVEQVLGQPAHPESIKNPQLRAVVEGAIAALTLASKTQEAIDGAVVARAAAKMRAAQDVKERKAAEARAKLR
jgi:hypothetical protein